MQSAIFQNFFIGKSKALEKEFNFATNSKDNIKKDTRKEADGQDLMLFVRMVNEANKKRKSKK